MRDETTEQGWPYWRGAAAKEVHRNARAMEATFTALLARQQELAQRYRAEASDPERVMREIQENLLDIRNAAGFIEHLAGYAARLGIVTGMVECSDLGAWEIPAAAGKGFTD